MTKILTALRACSGLAGHSPSCPVLAVAVWETMCTVAMLHLRIGNADSKYLRCTGSMTVKYFLQRAGQSFSLSIFFTYRLHRNDMVRIWEGIRMHTVYIWDNGVQAPTQLLFSNTQINTKQKGNVINRQYES